VSSRRRSILLTVISIVVVPAVAAIASTGITWLPAVCCDFEYSLISK
jgi:hypothetical protein